MPKDRSIKDKMTLLETAEELKDISAACRATGFSRVSYYRIKKAYDQGGIEALRNKRNGVPHVKKRISEDIEKVIIQHSLQNPLLGKHKISGLLEKKGVKVSATGVRNVLNRNDMGTFQDRMRALLRHMETSGDVLNKAQISAIEKIVRGRAFHKDIPDNMEGGRKGLEKRLEFETLISELSAMFINLPVDRIDNEIKKGQKLVCETLGLHRSAFMEFSEDKESLYFTHVWQAQGVSNIYPHDMVIDSEAVFFRDDLLEGKLTIFSDLNDLPPKLGDIKQALDKIGIASAVVFPLVVGTKTLGGISWESHGVRCHWTKSLTERLRLISEVFGNALSRKRAEEALRKSITEIKALKDRLQAENLYLLDEIRLEKKHHRIVGQSNAIKNVLSQVEQVADTTSTVLIFGETGTGKDLIAQAIHDLSPRKDHPMVKVNCSALPATLIESELFGHEKGAYTGALSKRMGRFEVASGSTIFLDEIGDLPLELQPKLLRVLQEGQYERLGSSGSINVDVRVIAATNRDLHKAVEEGRFRRDLFFRLNIFPITVPPLRDRGEDIFILVAAFVREFSRLMGKTIDNIPTKSLEALRKYAWPGNVRELKNLVERAMIISKGKTLRIQLPETKDAGQSPFESMDDMQRKHILKALERTGGRLYGNGGAANLLNLNPKTLESRMKKLGIRRQKSFSPEI